MQPANREEQGICISFEPRQEINQQQQYYMRYVFVFKIQSGVTEVSMTNDEYITNFLAKQQYSFNTIEEYANWLIQTQTPVTLYLVNSANYVGYSLTEPFQQNNQVATMGMNVGITAVDANPSGITLTLADGTVANRSFSRQVGEDWFPDIQKQYRFIKKECNEDPTTFDLNNLVGRHIDYTWDKIGQNGSPYLKIAQIYPAYGQQPNMNQPVQQPQPNINQPMNQPVQQPQANVNQQQFNQQPQPNMNQPMQQPMNQPMQQPMQQPMNQPMNQPVQQPMQPQYNQQPNMNQPASMPMQQEQPVQQPNVNQQPNVQQQFNQQPNFAPDPMAQLNQMGGAMNISDDDLPF